MQVEDIEMQARRHRHHDVLLLHCLCGWGGNGFDAHHADGDADGTAPVELLFLPLLREALATVFALLAIVGQEACLVRELKAAMFVARRASHEKPAGSQALGAVADTAADTAAFDFQGWQRGRDDWQDDVWKCPDSFQELLRDLPLVRLVSPRSLFC